MQISQIFFQDDNFPDSLCRIDNPPQRLFMLGQLPKGVYVAIVGTRNCTPYGQEVAYTLASELARAGLVIVSGLALGIDGIAHQAALDAGGKTVAVLANGLNKIYPASHRNLAMDILAHGGAILSEYPEGTPPEPFRFPLRNRIVAGLSQGVIVVESGPKGGSMITADLARDHKVVMAVPGDITRESSAGPNNLIRTGAVPIRNSSDVLEALELPTELIPSAVISAQNPHEARIIDLLKEGHRTTEKLIAGTELTPAQFASVVSLMEITGKIRNLGAGRWAPR